MSKLLPSKTLLIIGNGFDVACNYATKYSDFVKTTNFADLITNGNKLCKHIANIYQESNTKDFLKWVDLEVELYKYSKNLTEKYGLNNYECADEFRKEYCDLSKALQDYLTSLNSTKNNTFDHQNKIKKLLSTWSIENNIIATVCFNYTQFFHLCCQGVLLDKNKDLKKVHGNVYPLLSDRNNSIVLGIDDSMTVEPLHSFLYKSSNDKLNIRGICDLIESAEKYIIFGCSIGCTDEWYFKKIFSQKKKMFNIYYYGENEKYSIIDRIRTLSGNMHDFRNNNTLEMIDSTNI